MINPLYHRYLRLLKHDFAKYFITFLILLIAISIGSGMLVAGNSLLNAYHESFSKYHVEDGYFETGTQLSQETLNKLAYQKTSYYENFYHDEICGKKTIRFFKNRTQVDLASVLSGRLPQKHNEIAIDRLFARNNHYQIGDTIKGKHGIYTVCGLLALSDYSALFEKNSDTMFNAIDFGVGVMTGDSFDQAFSSTKVIYRYSFCFNQSLKSDIQKAKKSEKLLDHLNKYLTNLTSYVPEYENQAITYTGEDFSGDTVMIQIFIYILIVIIAFISAISIKDTMRKESSMIGTLRALGFSRQEMIIHYLILPISNTIIGAIVGNILGYTIVKTMFVQLYYGSYSLPAYHTLWNGLAFLETTCIPLILMIIIHFLMIRHELKRSPLSLINEEEVVKNKKHLYLSHKISLFNRFAMRILLQNKGGFLILLCGVLFSNFIALFGLMLPRILDSYQASIQSSMLAPYTYILQAPPSLASGKLDEAVSYIKGVQTKVKGVEKFTAYTLKTTYSHSEDVNLYGIKSNSQYIHLKLHNNQVYLSSAYADKYHIKKGDTIKLKEPYKNKTYIFKISGIYHYDGALCVFMNEEMLKKTFGIKDHMTSQYDKAELQEINNFLKICDDIGYDYFSEEDFYLVQALAGHMSNSEKNMINDLLKNHIRDISEITSFTYFSGYFSKQRITDLKSQYVGTVIDEETLMAVVKQLDSSIGAMMQVMTIAALFIYFVFVYLLTKMIVEKNKKAISLTKVLGFYNKEITKLYIWPMIISILIFQFITLIIDDHLLKIVWETAVRADMSGFLPYSSSILTLIFLYFAGIVLTIGIVFLEYRRIRHIPMDMALKDHN